MINSEIINEKEVKKEFDVVDMMLRQMADYETMRESTQMVNRFERKQEFVDNARRRNKFERAFCDL